MDCKFCKREIPDGALFCNYCGKKQKSASTRKKSKKRTNGEGSAYQDKRTGLWIAKIIVGYKTNGRAIAKTKSGFKTKTDALNYIPYLKMEQEQRGGKAQKTETYTLDSYWQAYSQREMLNKSKSTQTHYKTARNRIEDIAYVDISTLKKADLQAVVDKIESYDAAKDIKDLLCVLFGFAEIDDVAQKKVAKAICLPEKETEKVHAFPQEDIETFKSEAEKGDTICQLCVLMAFTGLMPAEVFDMTLDMIDFDNHRISKKAGKKTQKRKDTNIPISEYVEGILRSLAAKSENGKICPFYRDTFYDKFKKTKTRLGVSNLGPYSLRHSYATQLNDSGVDLPRIQKAMRHSSVSSTLGYIDTIDSDVASANELLEARYKTAESQ